MTIVRLPEVLVLLFTASLLAISAHGQAPQWPGWRGPTGDGLAGADVSPPLEWSEEHNLRWKVELPGLGNSSPIVNGDRIYLTAAINLTLAKQAGSGLAQPGPPVAGEPHRFIVFALDRNSGEEVWRTAVTEATPHEAGHAMGSHASASITCDGKRLLAFFGSRGLYCLDLGGKVLWQKKFSQMKTAVAFGEGSTPALHGDVVIVQWDEEGPSYVLALDANNGKELWRQARDTTSSWGSPVVTEVKGKPQVILTGSNTTRAYALLTGEPLWWCGGMSESPVNSPLVADGIVYVMNTYKGKVLQAISLEMARGEVGPGKGLLWSGNRDAAYVPPPLVQDGLLYYVRDSTGILSCVDARSGEGRYLAKRLGAIKRMHASPIAAAGRIYFTSREAGTVVIRTGPEFEVLASNLLGDVFDATPAFVGSEIYMRGRSYLYCIANAD